MKDNIRKIGTIGTKRILGFTATQIAVIVIIIVMLFFFGNSSIPRRVKQKSQISELESQIEIYKKQIEEDSEKLDELQSKKENLEKFARENYYMKKENEEVFVLE